MATVNIFYDIYTDGQLNNFTLLRACMEWGINQAKLCQLAWAVRACVEWGINQSKLCQLAWLYVHVWSRLLISPSYASWLGYTCMCGVGY